MSLHFFMLSAVIRFVRSKHKYSFRFEVDILLLICWGGTPTTNPGQKFGCVGSVKSNHRFGDI